MDFMSVGMNLLNGWLAKEGAEDQNVANAEQAQRQMDFQERMSNTSYQRAVKDLSAAGLNPMLAYSQGGASSPAGAQAQMQSTLGAGVNSAQAGAQIVPQIKQTEANTDKIKAEEDESRSRTQNNNVQTAKIVADTRASVSSADRLDELVRELRAYNKEDGGTWRGRGAFESYARDRVQRQGEEKYSQEHGFKTPQIERDLASSRRASAAALLDELEGDRGRAYSEFWKSDFGKAQPYIEAGLKDIHSAAGAAASARFGGFRLPGTRR